MRNFWHNKRKQKPQKTLIRIKEKFNFSKISVMQKKKKSNIDKY